MRRTTSLATIAAAALLTLVVSATPARADNFGVRAGYYTDAGEPFAGVEFLARVGNRIYFNPNFEYVFTDDPHFMTLNADFHYDFRTRSRAYVWAGAGLGVLFTDPKVGDSHTDVGLNLLFGVGLKGEVVPYVQAKVIVADNSEFVIGFGVRF
jgi:hypothetical protein